MEEHTCGTCVFWDNDFGEWGQCSLASSIEQDVPFIVQDQDGHDATMLTKEEFGCTEWEPLEGSEDAFE